MSIKRISYKIEPYRDFIPLIIIGIVILPLIWANILPNVFQDFNATQQILMSSSLSAIIAIILIYFGYLANNRLQYFHALKAIIKEMKHNCEEMVNFQINYKEAYGDCDNLVLGRWIAKSSSYTNWGDGENFHLKYLPSQAYFNFINKGYINQKEYLKFPSESIAHFYQFCIEFSRDLQQLENGILALKTGRAKAPIPIFLQRFPHKTSFQSPQEICKFLTEEFYPFYAKKNDFNDGIIDEYKKTKESLKDHEWLITGEESIDNINLVKYNSNLQKWNTFDWSVFFFVIPLIFLLIFLIPQNIKDSFFILNPSHFSYPSLLLNNFTHSSFLTHLFPNIVLYYIMMFLVFNFETNQKFFYYFMGILFVPISILLSLCSIYILPLTIQGASGIIAGIMGYAIYSSYKYFKTLQKIEIHDYFVFFIFLINAFIVLVTVPPPSYVSQIQSWIFSLFIFIVMLITLYFERKAIIQILLLIQNKVRNPKNSVILLIYWILLGSFLFSAYLGLTTLIPPNPAQGGVIIHSFIHYGGFISGLFIPVICERLGII
jgi:hypothetical protein